jgi:Nucleotidyl transferase AbiEii toxin, Type IV TA system
VSAYKTPAAFREALKAKLRALAKEGPWEPQQLQRQLAYDRLLERLYLVDDGWVVKGAVALLARDIGVRASRDVDVYRARATDVAESELRTAAERDVGDWFRFEVGPRRPVADGAAGIRLPVTAYVGATEWEKFHVDLVGSDLRMTGQPEDVPALARVVMPDIKQGGYRAYPLVDHIADKVAATFERHGDRQTPSTRFRDLVDLVAITRGATVDATAQMAALASEARRRGLVLPNRFDVPDRKMWEEGYRAEAGRSLLPVARDLDGALAVVRPFLDPLLDGSAVGTWDHTQGTWVGDGSVSAPAPASSA